MDADGTRYFCTGDIGQVSKKGCVQIIDRKKDLVKLQQGEYVALSKVENVLKTSQYTALPMVYALSSMSYCIALICPNEGPLMKLAASLGVSPEPMVMAVVAGSSLAFLSPVAHQANAMVMGPGGYRYRDFLRVGAPLALLTGTVATIAIPIWWPFAL